MNRLTEAEVKEFTTLPRFRGYSGEIHFNENIDESLCQMVQLSTGIYVNYYVSEDGARYIKSWSQLLCG
jgi:hypothetical protein